LLLIALTNDSVYVLEKPLEFDDFAKKRYPFLSTANVP
jgi:hypothetical protein